MTRILNFTFKEPSSYGERHGVKDVELMYGFTWVL